VRIRRPYLLTQSEDSVSGDQKKLARWGVFDRATHSLETDPHENGFDSAREAAPAVGDDWLVTI
jgi:hypothetical protein